MSGRRYPDKRESLESATARLRMLLAGCTDVALNAFTVDYLAATHRVGPKVVEYELETERTRRRRKLSNGGI